MYPVALSVRGRRALVVGGGAVAERKIRGLLSAEAAIAVISPALTPPLAALAEAGAIGWEPRRYAAGDLAGAFIAFAATDDDATNAAVVAEARDAGILVNDASDAERGDFVTPAVHRSGPLTVTIDSTGLSPSFTKRIRDELALQFDARYARAASTLGLLRERVQAVVPPPMRAPVMQHFAARDIEELAAMPPGAVEHEVERAVDTLGGVVPAQTKPLVCASRASLLALTQTRATMAALARAGVPSTVLEVTTRGDAVQDRSIAAIGTDNVFVKELELALREERADYAVHSCKDLPSTLAEDMTLAAVSAREDARDAYCSERYPSFADLPPGAKVGTSSPRRRAQLAALRPDLAYLDIRGNVDTRLRKLREGQYDAIVLAARGAEPPRRAGDPHGAVPGRAGDPGGRPGGAGDRVPRRRPAGEPARRDPERPGDVAGGAGRARLLAHAAGRLPGPGRRARRLGRRALSDHRRDRRAGRQPGAAQVARRGDRGRRAGRGRGPGRSRWPAPCSPRAARASWPACWAGRSTAGWCCCRAPRTGRAGSPRPCATRAPRSSRRPTAARPGPSSTAGCRA